jgi:L-ascorbate metabolism protein UlaG (beta-lactamase superfamily)
MRLRLIRHATLQVDVADRRLVVDPMLDPAGARPPIEGTPNPVRNPLVELPEPAEVVVEGAAAVLITHLHRDHLDDTAIALLPRDVSVFCAPDDADTLRGHGFGDVRPIAEAIDWDGVGFVRTGGVHGSLGPTSGFVLDGLYIAGDTIWCDDVRAALDKHRPDVVVVNAGAARYLEGDPIVMDADDVVTTARHASYARVVVVHLEAINHCLLTRADLHQRLHEEGLTDRVTVPEDGAEVPLP